MITTAQPGWTVAVIKQGKISLLPIAFFEKGDYEQLIFIHAVGEFGNLEEFDQRRNVAIVPPGYRAIAVAGKLVIDQVK